MASSSAASVISLKAELARKQTEFEREKNDPSLKDQRIQAAKSKRAASWLKQNKGVLERHRRDVLQNESSGKSFTEVEAKLKAKAALYERLRKGDMSPDEQEQYLVDFERKFLERIETEADRDKRENDMYTQEDAIDDGEQWVEYTDALGRKRMCMKKDLAALKSMDSEYSNNRGHELESEDMRRENKRRIWEEQMEEERNRPRGPIHYETVREGEIRNLGTGYYAFSTDEIERGKQRALLDSLRDETKSNRAKRAKIKEKRALALQARLEKIKQRNAQGTSTDSNDDAINVKSNEQQSGRENEQIGDDIDSVLDSLMSEATSSVGTQAVSFQSSTQEQDGS